MSKRYENEEEILIEKANGAGALLGLILGLLLTIAGLVAGIIVCAKNTGAWDSGNDSFRSLDDCSQRYVCRS